MKANTLRLINQLQFCADAAKNCNTSGNKLQSRMYVGIANSLISLMIQKKEVGNGRL
jgi:hypothetical protein